MLRESRVLVVDDTPDNILVLREILGKECCVLAALSGPEALLVASKDPPPDLILLDVLMPGMDGYEVCRLLKARERTRDIPILFVTTLCDEQDESLGLALGAVDYITKPLRPSVILARVRNHLRLKAHQDHLEELVEERTRLLSQTQDVAILSMAALAETRDNELGGHFLRTQHSAMILAQELSTLPEYGRYFRDVPFDTFFKSIPLHDVGKVGIPDNILFKPGKLTPGEFEIMKLHTVHGRDILRRAESHITGNSFLAVARDVAYTHHERWDGAGYPQGLCGEAIPVPGRIMAVVDVYDALISTRVYKKPIPHSQAVSIIAQGSGTHFDPAVADVFNECRETIRDLSLAYADDEDERAALAR